MGSSYRSKMRASINATSGATGKRHVSIVSSSAPATGLDFASPALRKTCRRSRHHCSLHFAWQWIGDHLAHARHLEAEGIEREQMRPLVGRRKQAGEIAVLVDIADQRLAIAVSRLGDRAARHRRQAVSAATSCAFCFEQSWDVPTAFTWRSAALIQCSVDRNQRGSNLAPFGNEDVVGARRWCRGH
jgi:hypothetical protein